MKKTKKAKNGKTLMQVFAEEEKRVRKSLAKAKIVHEVVDNADPESVAVLKALSNMIGGTITDAGFVKEVREGGFAFEFTNSDGVKTRLIFGFNDLGSWIEFEGKVVEK